MKAKGNYDVLGYLTFLLLTQLLFWDCSSADSNFVDPKKLYPLEIGRYQVYQVEEKIYSASQAEPTVRSWQEKDEVDRLLLADENSETYAVVRYIRNSASDFWVKQKEFTVSHYPDRLLTNIDNLNVFSLIFPVNTSATWNGNLYNNEDELLFRYEDVYKPSTTNNISFDQTLTVVERDDSTVINRYAGIKKYAVGVGLISDLQIAYEYCQNDACIGSGKIESGKYLRRTIIETSK